jgi:hypothetical protein
MTQIERSPRKIISGSGWSNPLSHSFFLENTSHLSVFAVDEDGVLTELTLGADYSVSGVSDDNGYDVTITTPGDWTDVDSWVLYVAPPLDQPGDVSLGGTYGARFELALDRIANRLQYVADLALRAIKSPLSTDPDELDQDDLVVDPLLVQNLEVSVDAAAASAATALAQANIAIAQAVIATTKAAEAAASAANIALPVLAANTMLVTNAAGTLRENKTFAQVAALLLATNAAFAQTGTGSFTIDQDPLPNLHKMTDRLFLDGAATFNGQFVQASMTGLSADAFALHNWGPRDASLFVDSSVAGMAIVGHSESNKYAGWSGTPLPAIPGSIGVAGFAINNRVGGLGQAWGGYFDAVRLTNGFTVGIEVAIANFGSETTPTPFNVKTGGVNGGVAAWLQAGAGLDSVGYPGTIQDASAGIVLLSSYADNSAKFRSGIVIADGALVDRSAGSFTYEAMGMPDRHQIAWYRSSDSTASAYIWADTIVGDAVGITFRSGLVEVGATTGVRTGGALIGDTTNWATITRVAGTNGNMTVTNPGTGQIQFTQNAILVAEINQFALNLTNSRIYAINSLQVVGARKTGWALATGTATRTTFATGSVTLPQLAEHVKALIDDLHSTAGHGLLGA